MGLFWSSALPLIAVAFLVAHEEIVSIPSCVHVPGGGGGSEISGDGGEDHHHHHEDLKVMMVANLLLLGSEAGFFNLHFRNYYTSKFFKKSFGSLKPDMLLVLGDVSAKGYNLTKREWFLVQQQFKTITGPFIYLPYHVVLGDRDVGECTGLDERSVYWISKKFPGLDSAGCSAFEISGISFVSLNAAALLCGNSNLRFSIEKVIERESLGIPSATKGKAEVMHNQSIIYSHGEKSSDHEWRENAASSGTGPILLLHFPLHHTEKDRYRGSAQMHTLNAHRKGSKTPKSRGLVGSGPYKRSDSLPPNETEYIFHALKPRIIFSAHTHEFFDYTHSDGTREVTVPAMTWYARDDPGFVIATFRKNRREVLVSHCDLARESFVLITHISVSVLLILTMFLASLRI